MLSLKFPLDKSHFITGGKTEKNEHWKEIKEACFEIGKILRLKKHSLELCSPFEDSADYWVFKGYASDESSAATVNFHYLKLDDVEEQIQKLESGNVKINKIPNFVREVQDNKAMKYAIMLCGR